MSYELAHFPVVPAAISSSDVLWDTLRQGLNKTEVKPPILTEGTDQDLASAVCRWPVGLKEDLIDEACGHLTDCVKPIIGHWAIVAATRLYDLGTTISLTRSDLPLAYGDVVANAIEELARDMLNGPDLEIEVINGRPLVMREGVCIGIGRSPSKDAILNSEKYTVRFAGDNTAIGLKYLKNAGIENIIVINPSASVVNKSRGLTTVKWTSDDTNMVSVKNPGFRKAKLDMSTQNDRVELLQRLSIAT